MNDSLFVLDLRRHKPSWSLVQWALTGLKIIAYLTEWLLYPAAKMTRNCLDII